MLVCVEHQEPYDVSTFYSRPFCSMDKFDQVCSHNRDCNELHNFNLLNVFAECIEYVGVELLIRGGYLIYQNAVLDFEFFKNKTNI